MIVHMNDSQEWYEAGERGKLIPIDPPSPQATSRQREPRCHVVIAGIVVPADDTEAIREAQEAARDR